MLYYSLQVERFLGLRPLFFGSGFGTGLEILRSAKKQRDENGGWNTIRVIEKNAKVLQKLGLAENPIVVKNPVGRPKKSKS